MLTQVNHTIEQVGVLVSQVNAASREQSQGVEQINPSVTQIDHVTQRVAANAQSTANASLQLTAQAQDLLEAVALLSAMIGSKEDGAPKLEHDETTEVLPDGNGSAMEAASRALPAPEPIPARPVRPAPTRTDSPRGGQRLRDKLLQEQAVQQRTPEPGIQFHDITDGERRPR